MLWNGQHWQLLLRVRKTTSFISQCWILTKVIGNFFILSIDIQAIHDIVGFSLNDCNLVILNASSVHPITLSKYMYTVLKVIKFEVPIADKCHKSCYIDPNEKFMYAFPWIHKFKSIGPMFVVWTWQLTSECRKQFAIPLNLCMGKDGLEKHKVVTKTHLV